MGADLRSAPRGGPRRLAQSTLAPEQFWAIHKMETEKWAKIVQFSGAKAE